MQYAANTQVVYVKATTAQGFKQRHDTLTVTEAPQHGRKRAEIKPVRANGYEVTGYTLHLADE